MEEAIISVVAKIESVLKMSVCPTLPIETYCCNV